MCRNGDHGTPETDVDEMFFRAFPYWTRMGTIDVQHSSCTLHTETSVSHLVQRENDRRESLHFAKSEQNDVRKLM